MPRARRADRVAKRLGSYFLGERCKRAAFRINNPKLPSREARLKEPIVGRQIIGPSSRLLLMPAIDAGVEPVDGRAPFVLFSVGDAELTRKHLHAKGIAVRRCDTFVGLDGRYLRAAVRPEWPRLVEAIAVIAKSGGLR